MFTIEEELEKSLRLLEPSGRPREGIVRLLLEKAKRNYAKYRFIDRRLSRKYNMSFDEFKTSELMNEPTFEVEQDFFDWDMATTGMLDMKEEIQKLEKISSR